MVSDSPVSVGDHVTVIPEKIATRGDDQAGLLDKDLITNVDYKHRRGVVTRRLALRPFRSLPFLRDLNPNREPTKR